MLFSIRENGAISALIPKAGQNIEEIICEELEVGGIGETEFFNPKMLTRREGKMANLFMLGKLGPKPDKKKNNVAAIITEFPEEKWCYGTYVIAYRKGGEAVAIPNDVKAEVLKVLQAISDIVMTTPEED